MDLRVEVETTALRENAAAVARFVGGSDRLMAVVKGNGFGHGTALAARAFVEGGAGSLGVTRLEEARELREAGLNGRVLVMVPPLPSRTAEARELGVEVAVDTAEGIDAFRGLPLHLKIDTGMGRLGCAPVHAKELAALAGGDLRAVFTHFPNAAIGIAKELARFREATEGLSCERHVANSAATFLHAEARLDLCRVGTALYGQKPWGSAGPPVRSGWRLIAKVVAVHERAAGSAIGYGSEFRMPTTGRVAVLAVGTADGFETSPVGPFYRSNPLKTFLKGRRRKVTVEIGGRPFPVIGRTSMQLTTVLVDDSVHVDDEAVVPALRLMVGAHIPRVAV